ncbi:MAG: hypothetical protein R2786_11395 [Flavobacteriaceae bacterium]
MKKIVLLAVISLLGCGPVEEEIPFYKFDEVDFNFLPTIYENLDAVRFKNELGEEIILDVNLYRISKERVGGLSLGGNSSPLVDVNKFEIKLRLHGEECSFFYFYTYKGPHGVKSWFDISSYSCGGSTSYSTFNFEVPYPISQLQIGNKTYEKVLIIEDAYSTSESIIPYEINRFYFDLEYGIIGFDDSESNINFRIVN